MDRYIGWATVNGRKEHEPHDVVVMEVRQKKIDGLVFSQDLLCVRDPAASVKQEPLFPRPDGHARGIAAVGKVTGAGDRPGAPHPEKDNLHGPVDRFQCLPTLLERPRASKASGLEKEKSHPRWTAVAFSL